MIIITIIKGKIGQNKRKIHGMHTCRYYEALLIIGGSVSLTHGDI